MDLPYYVTWTRQVGASTFPVVDAQGVYFMLEDGSRVLDMVSTSFQAAFGHSDARLRKAICDQVVAMPVASPKATLPLKKIQTDRLITHLGREDGKVFYTVSGAEAIENALKIARQITGRRRVAARTRSYHGATLGAMSVTGDWRSKQSFTVGEWTVRIPEPDEDPDLTATRKVLEASDPEDLAAICLETIPAMNGVLLPPDGWWEGMQQLARELGAMLIIDEVSCGFGRTGPDFAFHQWSIEPDMVCMAKAITGGWIPLGALWTSERIARHFDDHVLACGLTSYAHPVGLAAMGAVLDHLTDPHFRRTKSELEDSFARKVEGLLDRPNVTSVRVVGLLACIDLADGVQVTWERGLEAGLHLACPPGRIILAPPYVMSPSELDEAFRRLGELIG